ncbi:MAG: hypothetical protein M3209_03630 [Acidobacteriota bacterium]|nr:hypothetical protein [Acidobacteriota bacterium]
MSKFLAVFVLLLAAALVAPAQTAKPKIQTQKKFGPNVQAYLDYLENELTVTDARESQREVSAEYVRHNFNRVSALRQFAIKIASESDVDYVPEMEAVVEREFHLLFPDDAPKPANLKIGEVYAGFRFLGKVRNREVFYIFARLDPFEEEALKTKSENSPNAAHRNGPANLQKTEIKVAAETKPETPQPKMTRERILYGSEGKPQNPEKQPND